MRVPPSQNDCCFSTNPWSSMAWMIWCTSIIFQEASIYIHISGTAAGIHINPPLNSSLTPSHSLHLSAVRKKVRRTGGIRSSPLTFSASGSGGPSWDGKTESVGRNARKIGETVSLIKWGLSINGGYPKMDGL